MAEGADVEVAAELAVDPDEQIAVERRRDAERVVVREQERPLRFHEIGAGEQAVAGRERRADAAKKRVGAWRIEVTDVRSEKERQRPAGSGADRPNLRKARLVRRL